MGAAWSPLVTMKNRELMVMVTEGDHAAWPLLAL